MNWYVWEIRRKHLKVEMIVKKIEKYLQTWIEKDSTWWIQKKFIWKWLSTSQGESYISFD